ncbi:MAG: hypothetical protein Rubg2KO_14560 [Rubricoccaceae bacterium]
MVLERADDSSFVYVLFLIMHCQFAIHVIAFAFVLAGAKSGLLAPPAEAQTLQLGPDVTFKITGTVQPRVSYGYQDGDEPTERMGIGLRRARFQMNASYRDQLGFEFDFDGGPGTVTAVDLFGFYNVSETLQIRAGRQPGAQPRSYIPTSHSRIDAIERAAIAERWAGGTIGSSGRDIGLDLEYASGGTEAVLFVHSGTGSFSRTDGNFRESITRDPVTRGTDEVGLAVTGMVSQEVSALPGIEIGAFAGINPVGSDRTALNDTPRGYATGGAHLYWGAEPGSQVLRIKLDALGIRYDEVGQQQQDAVGLSGFGAIRVLSHGELFGRYERFWDDVDVDDTATSYLTLGGSYSISASQGRSYRNVRVTLAYANREVVTNEDAHLVVLQGQFAF